MIDCKDFENRIKNFLKVKKFLEAEQKIQAGLDKFPNQLNLLVIATEVYRALGDSKKSLSYSEILLIHYPGNPIGYIRKIHNFLDLAFKNLLFSLLFYLNHLYSKICNLY